jgi:hypothetical protein
MKKADTLRDDDTLEIDDYMPGRGGQVRAEE